MHGSYFHHLFLVCIWLSVKAPQLGCDAVSINGQQDRAAANQCWQKCSQAANVSLSAAKALESPETCYKECLKKSHLNVSTNSTPITVEQGDYCLQFVKSKSYLPKSHVKIYLVARGPKFYFANISWNISSDIARNWTEGYLVLYALQIKQDTVADLHCGRVLGMNSSFTGFSITNENLTDDSAIYIRVYSLSQERRKPDDQDWRIALFPKETHSSTVRTGTTTEGTTTEGTTTEGTIRPDLSTSSSSLPTAAIVAMCVTIAFVLVAVVIWWRFVDKKTKEESVTLLNSGFKFDAFIIYSSTDEKWVKKKLLSTLENKHNIKCCIHYRDFLPGVPFVDNMAESVYNSRKTIAVVSKSFLSSNYCTHELNIALHRLVERGDNSVIVIKLDDVEDSELPIELQFRSYIDFTKATDKKTWEHKLVHSFTGENCSQALCLKED